MVYFYKLIFYCVLSSVVLALLFSTALRGLDINPVSESLFSRFNDATEVTYDILATHIKVTVQRIYSIKISQWFVQHNVCI